MPRRPSRSRSYWSRPALIDEEIVTVLGETGVDRLEELEIACDFRKLVAPHQGDDHHVRVSNPCLELIEGAHLEVGDIRIAPGELLGHAIGGVGKADGEFVPRGKHALRSRSLWWLKASL